MHKFFRSSQKGQWNKAGRIAVLASFALLTGCATQAPLKAPTPSNAPLYALDTVAIETASNIKELSAIEAANLQKDATQSQWREFMFNLQAVPVELSKKETFNFVGTAQDAVKGVADLAGFNFHVVGSAPAQPLMVSIAARHGERNARSSRQGRRGFIPSARRAEGARASLCLKL